MAAVLDVLVVHGCRFVVVGSAARQLLGELVVPADLDVVVAIEPTDRARLVDALIELGGRVSCGARCRRIDRSTSLPWEWGWRVITPFGEIDVIVRFIDDTMFVDHDQAGIDVAVLSGPVVRCHVTRWAA